MRLSGWGIGCVLALAAITARAGTTTPTPRIEALGIEKLISQDELAVLWTYPDQSDALRRQLIADQQLTTADRDAKVQADRQGVKALDNSAIPIAHKLVFGGFWRDAAHRNASLDFDVFLVIQHSSDMEMRRLTLNETEPLVAKGVFSGLNYALMYDRLAVLEGRKQRFGTQVSCVGGHFELEPLEDPEKVDVWRKQYGFPDTLAESQADYVGMKCTNPAPKPKL
ncbi:DUF6624 domain-containing protein [Asticcacaulis solisilvae]|uniref:DUF6624 domain-containing protein n=1 Tax=Asticcacaulis solisilvae TaxID=1217274 RepID=UPI003FD796F8